MILRQSISTRQTFTIIVLCRPFGAWTLQRKEERTALKKWQQMWSTSIKGGREDDEREVLEMPNNYSRRCCNNFVEKFIAAKYLAREKKKSLLELRSKMRAEKKKKAKEMKRTELEVPMRSREVEKENLSKKPSNRRECRQGKKRLKEA